MKALDDVACGSFKQARHQCMNQGGTGSGQQQSGKAQGEAGMFQIVLVHRSWVIREDALKNGWHGFLR